MAVVGAALLDARGRGLRHYWDLLRGTSDGRPRESGSAVLRAQAEVEAAAGLARTALADSGHASLRSRVAVIVAPTSGAGAAVTDAERIARILGLAGPRIEAKPASVDGMIQAARQCLAEDSCDVALLGAFRVGKWGAGADAADSLLGAMLAVEPEGRARRGGRRVQAVLHPDGGSWHGLAAIAHALSPRGGAPALAGIGWIAWGAPLAEETPPPPAEDDAHAPLLPRLAVDPWGGEADNPLAGLAALLRAILALHHRVKPPAAAVVAGREVPALHPPFYVSAGLGPWIHGGEGPRRALFVEPAADAASTSLLVEEAGDADSAEGDLPWPTELVCVSAATRSGLLSRIERLTDYAARHPHAALADLAGALAAGPHDRERLVVIATDLDDLVDKLATVRHRLETTASSRIRSRAGIFYGPSRAVGREAKVAFLFPGQGSQFAGMGAELCVYMPAVRRWFDRLDATFDDGVPPSTLLFAPRTALAARAAREVENYLLSMEGGAQAGFVLNLAIHETLAGVGVRPDVLVGYSNGENSALIAAGALPRDANLIFHCLRELRGGVADGDAAAHIPRAAMMAVSQFEAHGIPDLLEAMDGRVYWAMDNCPGQMVLCAQTSALKEARERLRRAGALCLMLPFDRAYHTPWFEKKAKDLRDIYDALDVRPWHTPVYSCVTADLFPLEPDAIRALATRQWHSRVRFRETVERLHDEGVRIFIESGPDAKLTAFVDDTLKNRPHLAIPANRERRGALRQLQELLAQLFVEGRQVEITRLFEHRPVVPVEPFGPGEPADAPQLRATADHAAHDAGVAAPLAGAAPNAELVAATPAARTDQARLLARHFQMMNEFLETQERMFSAVAAARRGGASATSPAAQAPETMGPRTACGPLIDQVTHHGPHHLTAVRRFEPARDRVLLDHTLGRAVSRADPRHAPLTIVPFSFSMEAAAEVAGTLMGDGWRVVALSAVRGYRWLALDHGALDLNMEAAPLPDDGSGKQRVQVRLFETHTFESAGKALAFEAVVHLAGGFPAPPRVQPAPDDAGRPARWSAEKFYDYCSFHGPSLRSIRLVRGTGPRGMELELRVPDDRALFADPPRRAMHLPASLLDSAGQIIGYWLVEEGHEYFGAFPFSVTSYRQYAPAPPADAALVCRAWLRRAGTDLVADLDYIDSRGRLFARFDSVRSRYFDYGERFFFALFYGTDLSEVVTERDALVCVRVPALPEPLMRDGGGIWERALAHQVLNARERRDWYGRSAEGGERRRRLYAIVAAKELLRHWGRRRYGLDLATVDVEIVGEAQAPLAARSPQLEARGPIPPVKVIGAGAGCAAGLVPAGHALGLHFEAETSGSGGARAKAARRAAEAAVRAARARVDAASPDDVVIQPVAGEAGGFRASVSGVSVPVHVHYTEDGVLAACAVACDD